MDIDDVHDEVKFWDDLSGEALDAELVRKARCDEMQQFVKHNVFVKVPIEECFKVAGKTPLVRGGWTSTKVTR